MVEVLCDTSFLIQIATKRIKNISTFETEIGEINFVVPEAVIGELEKLTKDTRKAKNAEITLEYIKKLKKIPTTGNYVDSVIINHIKKKGGFVATIDKVLKNKIKNLNGSIISLSNDKIILESS